MKNPTRPTTSTAIRHPPQSPFGTKGEENYPVRNEWGRAAGAGGCCSPAAPAGSRRHTGGFTLIEMMIAMLLGLIVIAGVTSVFLAGQKSYRTNNALGEVESSSRIAFELMARDIREAGLTGCDSTNGRIANVLNNNDTDWWAEWGSGLTGTPLHGYGGADSADGDADQDDPAVTTGAGTAQRVAGTDSLQILSANSGLVSIDDDQEPPGNVTLNGTDPTLQAGDVVVVCSPDHAAIVQIAAYDAAAKTVTHGVAGGNPGNCATGLGYPTACGAIGNIYSFPTNSLLTRLTASDWYIGNNADGGRSLYKVSLQNDAGTPTPKPTEVVRNVTDMQITYLQPPSTSFEPATSITNWSLVNAVRVTLTVESSFQRASVKSDDPISRTYSATTTIRNRVE